MIWYHYDDGVLSMSTVLSTNGQIGIESLTKPNSATTGDLLTSSSLYIYISIYKKKE